MTNIAFLGLGAMGSCMAANLLKFDFTVSVWNRSPGPDETLKLLSAAPPLPTSGLSFKRAGATGQRDDLLEETNYERLHLALVCCAFTHVSEANAEPPRTRSMQDLGLRLQAGNLIFYSEFLLLQIGNMNIVMVRSVIFGV